MTNRELPGTLALVHPDFENHPAGREGDIGIIAYVDNDDKVYLRFTDEAEAVYPPDAIMVLKSRQEIFPSPDDTEISLDSYKDLFKISTLQDMGRGKDLWHALEIARDNPAIWQNSLLTVAEGLGHRQTQTIGR
jgi:hypothetical protein